MKVVQVILVVMLAGAYGAVTDDTVTSRFVEQIRTSSRYEDSAKEFIIDQWSKRRGGTDADAFLLEALAVVSEDFRAGLAAFEDDRHADCARIMGGLADAPDAYLAANAAVYEIKALVAADDVETAEQRISQLTARPSRLTEYTDAAAEVHYLKAHCELGNLEYAQAIRSLAEFLDGFPQAPQRLSLSAQQMLAELLLRQPGTLGQVTDLMDYAARRLANADAGPRMRQRQQQVIDVLDALIEDARQREQNSGGGSGGSSTASGSQSDPAQASTPMQDSQLPPGSPGPGDAPRKSVALPGKAWGAMKPAQRERIIQHLKDRFPDRYRQLVEQYYRQLAEEP